MTNPNNSYAKLYALAAAAGYADEATDIVTDLDVDYYLSDMAWEFTRQLQKEHGIDLSQNEAVSLLRENEADFAAVTSLLLDGLYPADEFHQTAVSAFYATR